MRAEWVCMTDELASLDNELTRQCAAGPASYADFRSQAQSSYATCLAEPNPSLLTRATDVLKPVEYCANEHY